ncbi:MAG TPA: glutaredoxin domain-containing protein [Kofleriaceae bacterium]|jgi:glutaredoxin-related protein|nr:glutaredoxin domain-containing protein [Kofleriaceae bacterium]
MSLRSVIDRARSRAFAAVEHAPGKLGELARKTNDVLGRPLADEHELADRAAFAAKQGVPVAAAAPKAPPVTATDVAPVIVYHMEKTRRDAHKLVEILDAHAIPHTVTNIQEDPAAQFAVRRDSKGMRLPVVFVAGECVGGREHLINLAGSGELKKKVFG